MHLNGVIPGRSKGNRNNVHISQSVRKKARALSPAGRKKFPGPKGLHLKNGNNLHRAIKGYFNLRLEGRTESRRCFKEADPRNAKREKMILFFHGIS